MSPAFLKVLFYSPRLLTRTTASKSGARKTAKNCNLFLRQFHASTPSPHTFTFNMKFIRILDIFLVWNIEKSKYHDFLLLFVLWHVSASFPPINSSFFYFPIFSRKSLHIINLNCKERERRKIMVMASTMNL